MECGRQYSILFTFLEPHPIIPDCRFSENQRFVIDNIILSQFFFKSIIELLVLLIEIIETEVDSNDILPLRQAKKWYHSCMDLGKEN